MLGTVGMMADCADHVVQYALAAYALPGQRRTTQDWKQIHQMACALEDRKDVAVPVHFLGLWDTVKVPGTPAVCVNESMGNVVSGRHAVAIDGGLGPFGECRIVGNPDIEEVWFRGTHCDVVGGPNAYWPLADITLDRMIDGMVTARAVLIDGDVGGAPAPTELDALAEGAPSLRFRKVPEDALVHASVDVYLRAHSDYWRRLPYRIMWADLDWAARAERMPCLDTAPAVRAEEDSNALTAVAS